MVRAVECVICGASIYSFDHFPIDTLSAKTWMSRFRIIYTFHGEPCVSGLGFFDPDDGYQFWNAPRDGYRCYDDPVPYKIMPKKVMFMYQPAHKDNHGFIIHDVCSQLVRLAYWPQDPARMRILEILNSLPFPAHGTTMFWGHTYGGILYFSDNRYPWEDEYAPRIDEGDVFKDAHEDPVYNSTFKDIFNLHVEFSTKDSHLSIQRHKDCFSKLPWEIRESIAKELSTADALRLRLVTAAYYPIITSQSFWLSRFQPDGECGFFVERWRAQKDTDWMSLYRILKQYDSPAVRNRKRIWQLAKSLVRLTNLKLQSENQSFERYRKIRVSEGKWHYSKRLTVTGDLFDWKETGEQTRFRSGCQLITTYNTFMPPGLTEIGFLVLSYFHLTYIVGIRYKDRDGTYIDVGYRPSIYDENVEEILVKLESLNGFILAMGSSGLHAVKVVSEKGISEWIGNPENSPITRRLASLSSVLAITTGFDGYKLVSLEISVSANVINLPEISIRERALWFPTIPDSELYLNEESYVAEDLYSIYRPIFWIHFGGPKGILLQYVNKIIVDTNDLGVCAIQFTYTSGKGYVNSPPLGRHKACFGRERHYFEIDGEGGERINMIKYSLCTDESEEEDAPGCGYLSHLLIGTNRKRGVNFINSVQNTAEYSVSIAPGTVPTGFYASQESVFGLISFGVISEFVSDEVESGVVDLAGRENELKISEVEIGKCKPELAEVRDIETESM